MEFSFLPLEISEDIANKIIEVINVFETSSKAGNYAALVVYKDFTHKGQNHKQITYGRSQTTEFGNLKKLVEMYINANGLHKETMAKYLKDIGRISSSGPVSLYDKKDLIQALKAAGASDPIMKIQQDTFFDRYYVQPAIAFFSYHKFRHPLSLLVIYDSYIHSGSIRNDLRQRFPEYPPLLGGNEKKWVEQYVNVRHNWLANHPKKILHNTRYRTGLFKQLISTGNWDLSAPFKTQGVDFN